MAVRSNISWCQASWNPTAGCSLESPGCTNCYAMGQSARLVRLQRGGKYAGTTQAVKGDAVWTGQINLASDRALYLPMTWRKPSRIFVNSMSDLFHPGVPDEFIERVFGVMAVCRQHEFLVLTKRAERMREWLSVERDGRALAGSAARAYSAHKEERGPLPFPAASGTEIPGRSWPLPNVWVGVSVEDRKRLPRLDELRVAKACIRFVSIEPLLEDLGPINLTGIDWTIVGGESGPHARPMDPAWARSIRDQCEAQGVPFFFKQAGGRASNKGGNLLDGQAHEHYPRHAA